MDIDLEAEEKLDTLLVGQHCNVITTTESVNEVAASMLLGGFIYGFLLRTFYPLSASVIIVTGLSVTFFVMGCCYLAQWINFRGGKMEMIRDE